MLTIYNFTHHHDACLVVAGIRGLCHMADIKTIQDILLRFDPLEDKYVSHEYQSFGVHLAQKLGDERRKALYIKLAKTLPRPVLEAAYRFVIDSHAKNMGALFMWKLKEMGAFEKKDAEAAAKKEAKKKEKELLEPLI